MESAGAWGRGVLGAVAGVLLSAPLAAQGRPEVAVELTGRVQIQFSTSSVDEETVGEEVVGSTFETRRVRFGAEVSVGEWILGKVEPELAGGSLRLADAWVALELDPAATLKVGHFKRPFSLLELTSSTRMLPIERGLRIRGAEELLAAEGTGPAEHYFLLDAVGYVGRDLGASLGGGFGRIGYEVGLFNGSGSARDANDAKTFAGRLTVTPSAGTPLTLGAGFTSLEAGVDDDQDRGTALEVDLEYGRFETRGLHLMGEVALGDYLGADAEFLGAQAIAAWFAPLSSPRLEGVELLGRVSWADAARDFDGDEGLLLTPGINLYVLGRNRLMLNWDFYLPSEEGTDVVHAVRAQANVYF